MKKSKKNKQIDRLKNFYNIRGDGIAQLDLEKASQDQDFKEAIRRLANISIDDDKTTNQKKKAAQ